MSQSEVPLKTKSPTTPRLTLLALLFVVLVVIIVRWAFGLPFISTSTFHGRLVEPPVLGIDFTLLATTNQPMALHDFRGHVTLVYFGYTFCPDICPTTLAKLTDALKQLAPAERAAIQVVMVTVDPQRDNVEHLMEYLAHFDASFIGFTGTEEEIAVAAAPFNIVYQKHPGTVNSGYLVDHTASVAVLDKTGNWRLVLPFDLTRDQVVADLKRLLRE